VLQLTGGVAFGMHVAQLLELQGPLHGDRIAERATDEQDAVDPGDSLRQLLDRRALRQHLGGLFWERAQGQPVGPQLVGG
jgi:hypothetical protein